jgi:hypothetical protein
MSNIYRNKGRAPRVPTYVWSHLMLDGLVPGDAVKCSRKHGRLCGGRWALMRRTGWVAVRWMSGRSLFMAVGIPRPR